MEEQGRRHDGDRGTSMVEYALLVALVALVCVAGIEVLGAATGASLNRSGSLISSATR